MSAIFEGVSRDELVRHWYHPSRQSGLDASSAWAVNAGQTAMISSAVRAEWLNFSNEIFTHRSLVCLHELGESLRRAPEAYRQLHSPLVYKVDFAREFYVASAGLFDALSILQPLSLPSEPGASSVPDNALQRPSLSESEGPQSASIIRATGLGVLRTAFGLTLSELAEVCRVSRPQLYRWVDPHDEVALQMENRDRLNTLCDLADKWMARGLGALDQIRHAPVVAKRSLIDLLRAAELELPKIEKALDQIATRIKAAPSAYEKLRSRGLKTRPNSNQQRWDE